MIFTATETSTRFYITKGWSANSETPLQEITLDYLTIVEIPNQINYISWTSLNNNLTMLSNSGVNINDSLSVKGYLNAYYNAQFSYLAYQQVISNCATYAGSYVLPRKGTQADFLENGYRFGGAGGQEKDDEIFIGAYTAEYWEYDSRLGRRWNVDPVDKPWQTRYHAFSNKPIWNIDPNGANDDNYTIHDDGKVDREVTDDKTDDNFKYQAKDGKTTDLGTFKKLENGLINVPKQGEVFVNHSDQTSPGKDRNYVDPKIFAGILGAGFEYKNETGLTMQINQLNDKDGGHSGHTGKGGFADIRYANTKGDVNEPVWTNGQNFDLGKSQLLVDKFTKFGFNQSGGLSILTENGKGNGPALRNTRFVNGNGKFHHKHHIHLQRYNFNNINTITN